MRQGSVVLATKSNGHNAENARVFEVSSQPVLDDSAYYGFPGDFVKALDPHTEADPAGILLQFLIAFGNSVGDGPYFQVEGDRHPPRENLLLVGDSSKGRKGTSWGRIRQLFDLADPVWSKRIQSGASSGEGIVFQVRDPMLTTGKDGEETLIDPGEEDKRLLLLEPEFASVLKAIERDGNTLSAILRQAWDTGDLTPLTKNNRIRATGAHISIVGHITQMELLKRLSETEMANGFANRFLWIFVRRSKLLPNGGCFPEEEVEQFARTLQMRMNQAREIRAMHRSPDAQKLWEAAYPELGVPVPGLAGALLSRSEAHVLRLSLLYALTDGAATVELHHMVAALSVWNYVEACVTRIFGTVLGNPVADKILESLNSGPKSATEISHLFDRNISSTRIQKALQFLVENHRVEFYTEKTGGRNRQIFCLTKKTN
uniref:DUF3987 domain-containing protein n=1 Tax=Leptospirillum sp. Group II '5-way CG' TaxID=419541 RepID=B6ALG0_9BACT|nr:MAG: Hypothetical protein CGL2_11346193 [Leptospirillum sp. Group II '5-way CG']